MTRRFTWWLLALGFGFASVARAAEVVINFDQVEVGKPVPAWTNQGVVFKLTRNPSRNRAAGRVMFFPHLDTDRKGILNAVSDESIPVQLLFPNGASSVTLKLWGSIGSAALVEAVNDQGEVVDKASLPVVPKRSSPADPIPSFELTVKAANIASVRFSGSKPGGFLAAEEVRFTPLPSSAATNTGAAPTGTKPN